MVKFMCFLLVFIASTAYGAPDKDLNKNLIGRKYQLPEYNSSFVVSKAVYDKANAYYRANYYRLSNKERFVVIDFSLNANQRRFLYLDITGNSFTTYLVSHGLGSDPDGDGNATVFSDRWRTRATALGAYRATDGDDEKGEPIMRLKGLDDSNDNAKARDIVVKGDDYVNEAAGWAGRSWGAFVMDPTIVAGVIERLEDGVIIFAAIP